MNILNGKDSYEHMEIPEELHLRINDIIISDRKKKTERKVIFMLKRSLATAAVFLAVFTAGLNVSPAFAETASELPIIGTLAKVLTIRSYHTDEGDFRIDMEVPAIISSDTSAESTEEFTNAVNAEIQHLIDEYTASAKEEFEEYKKAFFATGGTESEWDNRQMDIIVDYEIKYQKAPILSLELITAKGWVAASEERHYYNLDLDSGMEIKLSDLLGEDWIALCNKEIDKQISERIASDPGLSFYGYGDNDLTGEKFSTIDETTDYYINADGNVVIVFPEYSIAPGYMGIQEFVIELP